MILNVGTDELVAYTAKLEKLHRSSFPYAVRTALNSAAFDVKQNTLLKSADRNFQKRRNNFFKANSHVNMAKGWDIDQMRSEIGMVPLQGDNYAVDDLEQQEYGGKIKGKSFIPLDKSRTGKSYKKMVKAATRISKIENLVIASKIRSRKTKSGTSVSVSSKGEKFVVAVHVAGRGGFVMDSYKSKQIVWRVNSLNKTRGGSFKLTPLFSYEKGRSIDIDKPKYFMKEAATETSKKIADFYIEEAERQINKVFR